MKFTTLLLFLFSQSVLLAQTLKNVSVNLDPSGHINDVKYIAPIDKYLLVGTFTSIQGHPVNNLALLDNNFNYVNATFPTINDEIKALEVYNSSIFIGGSFTTVAGQTQKGVAKLAFVIPTFPSDPYVFTLQSGCQWLNTSTFYTVTDMDLNGNEIVVTGAFYDTPRNGILAFSASSGNLLNKFIPDNGFTGGEFVSPYCSSTARIEKIGTRYMVVGHRLLNALYETNYSAIMTFDNSGNQISGNTKPSYYNLNSGQSNRNYSLCALNDTVVLTHIGLLSGSFLGAVNISNPFYYPVGASNIPSNPLAFEKYNNSIFYLNTTTNMIQKVAVVKSGTGTSTTYSFNNLNSISINSNAGSTCVYDMYHVVKNFLFVSSDNLSTVSGQTRTGLAVICLEPENPKPMNNLWDVSVAFPNPQPFELDTIVCAGNIKAYTVPPVNYANGYKWTFSGSGVKYYFANNTSYTPTETDFVNASNNDLNGSVYSTAPTANKIWLMFDESFTGGSLKVEPFSTCNSSTDYLLAKPSTTTLVLAPLPDIQLEDSLVLNCLNDTLDLVVSSLTPNISLSWVNENGNTVTNDSIQLVLNNVQSVSFPRYFQATVKQNTGNMCVVKDSVHVNRSVIKPQMTLQGSLPIWNCYTDSLQITIVDTNSLAPESAVISSWSVANGSYSGSYPLTLHNPQDPIWFLATYLSNGCVDSSQFTLSTDLVPPIQQIAGYSSGFQQVGTITCTNDSLLVVLSDYNSVNSDNFWIYEGDTIQDSLWISATDMSYSISDTTGANLVTITIDEYRINPLNGCSTFGALAAVVFDIRKPNITNYSGINTLTCSDSQLLLDHVPTFGVPAQGWLLPNGTLNNSSTIVINSAGEHIYVVEGINGCLNTDTVQVEQTNQLLFESSMDTLVCPGVPFTVIASAIGTGTMSYSWSNGIQTIMPNGVGGIDSIFIVQVTNGSGCLGIDTLMARITSPIVATFEAFSSCGSGGFIQVDSISGGGASNLSDYLFAFNGGAYSTNYNFPVSQIASYPLLIKDTLGCEYSFTTEITGVIQTPGVNFLVSTYNKVGDTIALVNISDFSDFDGVFWTFPSGVDLVSSYDSVAIFTAIDTGWYQIQFTGYLIDTSANPVDTCFYSYDKYVYFGNFAMNFGDSVVDNSIGNVQIYPNPIEAGQSQTITLSFDIASLQQYEVLFTTSLGEILPYIADEGTAQGTIVKSYNLPPLASGTYLIHILAEYGAAQIKLVVQ